MEGVGSKDNGWRGLVAKIMDGRGWMEGDGYKENGRRMDGRGLVVKRMDGRGWVAKRMDRRGYIPKQRALSPSGLRQSDLFTRNNFLHFTVAAD